MAVFPNITWVTALLNMSFLSIRNHISVLIGPIWCILSVNDKYYRPTIFYKSHHNPFINTWVIAIDLARIGNYSAKAILGFCVMNFTFPQSYYN